jgi:anti-anti-sigma factor
MYVPQLRVESDRAGDLAQLRLVGDLDVESALMLSRKLDQVLLGQPSPRVLRLDLAEVQAISSLGIATLLRARERAAALDCRVVIAPCSAAVRRTVAATGLSPLFYGDDPADGA